MLSYTETVQRPRLVITNDGLVESPREWSNIGHFITISNRYRSPDNNTVIAQVIQESGNAATSLEHHMELITERLKDKGEEIVSLIPVHRYEHGIIRYGIGHVNGFDYSNNGFYVVTKDSLNEYLGEGKTKTQEEIKEIIEGEIDVYNKWCNGEVYRYELYDNEGELFDSCSGFYGIEDIRESLPSEFDDEDLEEYIKQ